MKQQNGKDCLQTVLSEGLNIDYNTIPKFYENDETWEQEYNNWLKKNNLFRIIFGINYSNMEFPYCSMQPVLIIGILHKGDRKHDHAVILTIDNKEVTMQDPKPESDYSLTNIIQIEMIFRRSV